MGQQVRSTVTQQIPTSELQLPPPLLGIPPGGIQDPNFPYVSVDTYPLHSGSGPKTFLPSAPLLPRRQVGGFAPREEKSKNYMPTQKPNVPSVRGPSPLRPLSNLRKSPAIHRRNSLPLRNIRSSSNPVPPKVRSQNHQDQQRRRDGTSQNSPAKQTPPESNSLFPGNIHDNANLIPPSQNPQHYQRPADGSSQNTSVKENPQDENPSHSPVIVNGSCQILRPRHWNLGITISIKLGAEIIPQSMWQLLFTVHEASMYVFRVLVWNPTCRSRWSIIRNSITMLTQ